MGTALPLEAHPDKKMQHRKREVPVIEVETLASPRDESNSLDAAPVSFLRLFRCANSCLLKPPHQQAGSDASLLVWH